MNQTMSVLNQKIMTSEDCDKVFKSVISYEEKIRIFAEFLRKTDAYTDKELIKRAMHYLIHLQFKHRTERNFGLIVTEDEYWAIRNVVWNIDKQIFWDAVGKRLLHLYDESGDQWIIFNDDTGRWEGYDGKNFEKKTVNLSQGWNLWGRVFNDDRALHFKWYEGAGTSTVPFAYVMKHDASTFPLPYVKQDIMDDEVDAEDNVTEARPQAEKVLGRYVIDPHPGMSHGIYGDEDKFFDAYFRRYWKKTGNPYWYDSGDGAVRHGDGYFHIIGRVGYAFNWNGHISGAEDVEGTLRDHLAVKDVMIAPIKGEGDYLDCLQVFLVLNEGYHLDAGLKWEFDDFIVRKKQKTFK